MKHCAPTYNSLNVDTVGRVGHCCVQRRDNIVDWTSVSDLNEWYKTDAWMRSVREDLDNGIENSACNTCWSAENKNQESRRQRQNKEWPALSGITLEHLDLRLSNKCNLQCKMCSGGLSDKIAELSYELTANGIENDLANSLPSIKNSVNIDYFLSLVLELPDLKTIRFAGGEPFIMPEVEEFLVKLVECGKTDIGVEFITNCTSSKNRILDALEKFKSKSLICSIDAVGAALEYQRYPSQWANIERNFIKMYNTTCEISISPCISLLTYLNLPEFFTWTNQFPDARVAYNEVDFPSFLNFRHVPLELREDFYKKFQQVEFKNVNKNWYKFRDSIMYEHKNPTNNDRRLLKHYSQDIWDYRCNVKFLDAYPWAESLL